MIILQLFVLERWTMVYVLNTINVVNFLMYLL